MFKDLFNKKRKYATIPSENSKRDNIPEGLMNKCSKCGTIQFNKELEKNLKVCSGCGYHFRLNAKERFQITLDEGRLFEFDSEMISEDPLEFPGYKEKIKKHQEKTGSKDAVITGEGTIGGFPVVVAGMSFEFFGGSMGSVVGEKVTRAIETAMNKNYPLIIFSTSGGARMEESILSLMQMAKTSAALKKFSDQGGLYISIITDPTFGGVPASFAMLGDYIIAEPGAAFGFTGRRVIEQTIRQNLPETFQTAEFNLKHGQLDKVVSRDQMRSTLIKLLDLHLTKEESDYGE
ncbi:acetyl-CoA carboxylase, carboxyltransferase subunit beta [Chengkuizengella axinellae]|uniref:Acetyl-coenzyme A carboxylase carboxyl transferase subunit beta n=1 Tax=Chengkuizengella axinellae TaxID=3064388 RepID=A0ABT9J055_9BACL|nr:acetyl-CoA carboxylase, carboxyltransferase subunit beta [Chengkuizengella sp. 2205SS18-9]MDP5274410.1 acetyl-CoA carboxylase, carboxyltransferase subunit beta [Chengkuizengella sp. 2205SS18-9]